MSAVGQSSSSVGGSGADHCTVHIAFDIEEEFDRKKAQLEKLLGIPLDTPADPSSIVGRILSCLSAGDAIELLEKPTVRAGHFIGSLEFTDSLFELLPALSAVQLSLVGHEIPPSLLSSPTAADHGLGSVNKADPAREDGES